MAKLIVITLTLILVGGFLLQQLILNSVNTVTVSKKDVVWHQSQSSKSANDYFWQQFHDGNYDSIPEILAKLTSAYVDNPGDIRTIDHLAFTHMWALSERQNSAGGARIIEHATLAQKYFGESYLMNKNDARVLSFLSSVKMAQGAICGDPGLLREGYLNGKMAIDQWENFSMFSLAYTLSRLPAADDKFKKALDFMRILADRHAENFDPDSRDTQQQVADIELLRTSTRSQDRVFHNSWIAPHNIEGFFMTYGDMLVKNGDWEKAVSIYKLCRCSRQFAHWDYNTVLEKRILNARRNVELFRRSTARNERVGIDDAILVNTGIACRSCHQMSEQDREKTFAGYDETRLTDPAFYFLE